MQYFTSVPSCLVSPGIWLWWNQGHRDTVSYHVRSDLSHKGAQAGQSCRGTAACPYCPVGHEPSSVIQAATPYQCTLTGNWEILVLYNEQTLDPNIPISVCSLVTTCLHSHPDFRHKPLVFWWTGAQPLSSINPQLPGHSMVPIGISQSPLWFPHSKGERAKLVMLTFTLLFLKYSFLLKTLGKKSYCNICFVKQNWVINTISQSVFF